jgi:hypothetical protein
VLNFFSKEGIMHKLTLTLVAGAVGALAVSTTTRSEAGALAGAEGVLPAIDDVSPVVNVHWRRYGYGWRRPYYAGWRGYGWRRPYYAGWRGYGWRRPYYAGWGGGWGWRRPIYGAVWGAPVVGVGIGFGRPWGWGGWGWGGPRVGIGFGWGW